MLNVPQQADGHIAGRIDIRRAELTNMADQNAILELTDQYARHPMGGEKELRAEVRDRLISGLLAHPGTVVFIARIDGMAVGLATCFRGFSTFAARPLINIHDLTVVGSQQGRGIGRKLIETVIDFARSIDCCALTLEVRMDNIPARRLYDRLGFRHVGQELGNDAMLFGKLKLD